MRRTRFGVAGWLLIASSSLLASERAVAGTAVSFGGTLPDASGIERLVAFAGERDGDSLTGTVTIEGNDLRLVGVVRADGSVVGTVYLPNGSELGTFSGRVPDDRAGRVPTGDGVADGRSRDSEYDYDMAGRSGAVAVPALEALTAP